MKEEVIDAKVDACNMSSIEEKEEKPTKPDYDAWQRGEMDYMGVDSFTHIEVKLNETISKEA